MNNNNPFLSDLQKKLFPPKSGAGDAESVGNPELDDMDGLSDEDDDEIEIKSDSPPAIRVSRVGVTSRIFLGCQNLPEIITP
jgi:hypothetical protein